MIYIKNDRSVFPNNVKVSNQYENETRTIQFDLSDAQFTGNTLWKTCIQIMLMNKI